MNEPSSHALVDVEHGALLLDLRSGQISRLNRSAAFVWRHHLTGVSASEIAELLSQRFGVPLDVATRDAALALVAPAPVSASPAASEFRYERSSLGYRYLRSDKPLFEIRDDGTTLALVDTHATHAEMRIYLRNVAPKILSLRGHIVLHAAAVAMAEGVVAFAGESGAGKTTTARALVQAGARAVAEDKLILNVDDTQVRAVLNGESLIQDWVGRAVTELEDRQTASCAFLDVVAKGSTSPLAQLGFVDLGRRRAGPISARRIGALEAAGSVFQRAFLLSDATDDWIRHLRTSVTIANGVTAYDLEMPHDLETLAEEAQRIVARASIEDQNATGS
jgi:Coenzyme PQQ synthesis protein D (PqqD)